jgi:AcrR family transcriptional regulator
MTRNTNKKKAKLVKELRDQPFPEIACRRAGVSRATFYRWLKDDLEFKAAVERADELSRGRVTDLAESKIIEGIKNGDYRSSVYWLAHNTKRYRTQYARPYIEENEKLREEVRIRQLAVDEIFDVLGDERVALLMGEVDVQALRAKIRDQQRKRLFDDPPD